jgi:uncharacterized protein (TIGR02600 family)
MKTPSFQPQERGSSILLVLVSLATILIVILSVAQNAMSERRASSIVKTSLTTGILAATVENLVQSTIRDATTLNATETWSSQPGMIRNFGADGSLLRAYKLYSSRSDSVVSGSQFQASLGADINTAALTSAQVRASPALYVDLNEPSLFRDEIYYPISDPRALGKVEGFKYNAGTTPAAVSYEVQGQSKSVDALPMPVAWLYVLQDGQIVVPTTGPSGRAVQISGASKDNPVIGRMAYWTDDDSCKLNVNTAADGSYWDTPRSGNFPNALRATTPSEEVRYATYQPAQKEFQRYPGHPATTSIAPVLGAYFAGINTTFSNPSALREELIRLSPRYTPGGSSSGTVVPTGALVAANRPFYESVDEYFFTSNQSVAASSNRTARDAGLVGALEQTRFFLTTQSRAPEVNLFNLPRVSIWPVSANSGNGTRTVNDNLNLFCSTLGATASNTYAFTRSNPNATDGEMSGRNLTLYNYLDSLTARPFPGFGPATFQTKYGSDRAQILTQIVDFIRCVNITDQSMATPAAFTPFTPRPAYNVANNLNAPASRGTGQVVPMRKDSTMGFGRFPTISEAAIIVVGEQTASTTYNARAALALELTCVAQGPAAIVPRFNIQVDGLNGIQFSTDNGTTYQSAGFAPSVTHAQFEMNGYALFGGTMGLAGENGTESKPPAIFISNPFGSRATTGNFTDVRGQQFMFRQTLPIRVSLRSAPPTGSPSTIQNFEFQFPPFTSNFPAPLGSIENNDIEGPANTQFGTATSNGTSGISTLDTRKSIARFSQIYPIKDDVVKSLVPLGGGVNADLRLVAASPDVQPSIFVPNWNYDTIANNGQSHSLSYNSGSYGRSKADGRFGLLLGNQSLTGFGLTSSNRSMTIDYAIYDLPPAVNGVRNSFGQPGDFDTGISWFADGPWINKTDDGDIVNSNAANAAARAPYYVGSLAWATTSSLFSPNRQIASAVQFGSLPSGVKAGNPWQTLLFCPNPAAVTSDSNQFSASVHPGFGAPSDHLLLDLFWMPVVEPYAISDPLSTAGKVNLNQQILPFTQIERTSALRGILKTIKVPAIPNLNPLGSDFNFHKWGYPAANNYRYDLNLDKTITEIARKWSSFASYVSATEICKVFLIPNSATGNPVSTAANLDGSNIMSTFWRNNSLTGDNLRERPYAAIYPRLTTQSNVFTVHYTIQTLQKTPSSAPDSWDEDKDKILGEQRGSTTLERYIDPRDPEFSLTQYDFAAQATNPNPPTLGRFYKFRTISSRQFRP